MRRFHSSWTRARHASAAGSSGDCGGEEKEEEEAEEEEEAGPRTGFTFGSDGSCVAVQSGGCERRCLAHRSGRRLAVRVLAS